MKNSTISRVSKTLLTVEKNSTRRRVGRFLAKDIL